MTTSWHIVLSFVFVLVGLAAASLQYWLWGFPMVPDPGGQDPNGKTAAPPFWRAVHRLLGYTFSVILAVMTISMMGRLGGYAREAWTPGAVTHVALAIAAWLVLAFKIGILRKLQRYGRFLPLLGSVLALAAVVVGGSGVLPALRIRGHNPSVTGPERERALGRILSECNRCHGLSMVASHLDEGEEWADILEEMTEKAERSGVRDPVGGDTSVLVKFFGGGGEHGRGRGRGMSDSEDD